MTQFYSRVFSQPLVAATQHARLQKLRYAALAEVVACDSGCDVNQVNMNTGLEAYL